jgi:predicted O-methyltransferase YrrM
MTPSEPWAPLVSQLMTNGNSAMPLTHRSDDADTYRFDYKRRQEVHEPAEREEAVVDAALAALVQGGMLPHIRYDLARFEAHRAALHEAELEIPWTAISPRMQRLLYAINAIRRPDVMVAVGVFCGYTFLANAGAAVGPGAVYDASLLAGVEINPAEAERAARNVRRVDPTGTARIVAGDGIPFVANIDRPIDLLYLDADGAGGRGKAIYLDILLSARPRLASGALILAHNSVNCASSMSVYLDRVRNPANCPASCNVIIDDQGLEVSAAGPS